MLTVIEWWLASPRTRRLAREQASYAKAEHSNPEAHLRVRSRHGTLEQKRAARLALYDLRRAQKRMG